MTASHEGTDTGAPATPSARYSAAAAEALWAAHFSGSATAARIASEADAVFRMSAADADHLFRITDDGAGAALQVAVLDHLAATGLPVPAVRRAIAGDAIVTLPGTTDAAFATSFLPGKPLAPSPASRTRVFALLGRLDRALAGLSHPGARRSLLWDVSRADQVAPLVEAVPDAALRDMARAAIADWRTHAAPALARLPRQIIHNDVNPSNVLVSDDGTITGVIDFGDVVEAPRICDLATAIAYQPPVGGFAALIAEAVAAYDPYTTLSATEHAILPVLVRARAAMIVAITHMRAARDPANRAYYLRNQPRAVALLAAAA